MFMFSLVGGKDLLFARTHAVQFTFLQFLDCYYLLSGDAEHWILDFMNPGPAS